MDLRRWTVVEIVGLVHFGYKRYMFCFAFKGPGCWGRCHSLSPVEPRDRNRMMDNNKVMSVWFGAFCFRLVGHLRTTKYVRRSSPVSLTCKPPIMLLCCGFVTRCSCNYIGMPNRVANFSLHSSIPRVWFVSVYRYWFLNLFVCLFVFFFLNVRNSNKREVPKNNPPKHNGIMYFNSSGFVYTNITPSVKFADSPVYFDIPYLNKWYQMLVV